MIAFTSQKYISMACGMACKCVLSVDEFVFTDDRRLWVNTCLAKNQTQRTVDIHGWNTLTEGAVQWLFANRVGSLFKGLIPGPQFWG